MAIGFSFQHTRAFRDKSKFDWKSEQKRVGYKSCAFVWKNSGCLTCRWGYRSMMRNGLRRTNLRGFAASLSNWWTWTAVLISIVHLMGLSLLLQIPSLQLLVILTWRQPLGKKIKWNFGIGNGKNITASRFWNITGTLRTFWPRKSCPTTRIHTCWVMPHFLLSFLWWISEHWLQVTLCLYRYYLPLCYSLPHITEIHN